MWFTDEAIAAWVAKPRATRGGQPRHSPLAILTALTLRRVFRLAYRQAEGLLGSVIGLPSLSLRVLGTPKLRPHGLTPNGVGIDAPAPLIHAPR